MAIRITDVRLTGGQDHEHVTYLWWTDPASGGTGDNSRAQIVKWIEDDNGKAYVDCRRSRNSPLLRG